MEKVTPDFVRKGFSIEAVTQVYTEDVEKVGLWKSERLVAEKFFRKKDRILDIGCGAGRSTFGLYEIGFHHITGVDLTPEMINAATKIAKERNIPIRFEVGNALKLHFEDAFFDGALFSFNGIMQIPGRENRVKAMKEIARVLKSGSVFFFTTHCSRSTTGPFGPFWMDEEKRWAEGKQDPRLHEFGDRIIPETDCERDLFLHFPTEEEVIQSIRNSGLKLLEFKLRSKIAKENDVVENRSLEVLFWVTRKP